MGTITSQNLWVVLAHRVNLSSEINFHSCQPTKKPGAESVWAHEWIDCHVVCLVSGGHFFAEATERDFGFLDHSDEIPTNFISCTSQVTEEKN
jgi:hypothetical protein